MEINVGKKHNPPKEYTYLIKSTIGNADEFINLLTYQTINYTSIGNLSRPEGIPVFQNGCNKILDKDVYIIDQNKQGYYYFWFKSKNDANDIFIELRDIAKKQEFVRKNPIYKYSQIYKKWIQSSSFQEKNPADLIGYHHYLDLISKDIDNYIKYNDFLKSIGEGYRTMNYLLYGPPGTGKTTLIKTFATIKSYPVYIVSADDFDSSAVLNPINQAYPIKLILVEDFDRCLEDPTRNVSEILNSLDGIETSEGCIRFFTANNVDIIMNNKAIVNRMNSKFEFFYPTREQYIDKLQRFLKIKDETTIDKDKMNMFIDLVVSKTGLTLRPFSNYVTRYIFNDDYFDQLIANIDEI